MPKTVLIVDDSPTAQKHLGLALRSAGYKTVGASDGMVALELLARPDRSIDLIITDLNMPNLDGFGLIRAVRSTDRDIPIIIVSSISGEAYRQVGLDSGADAYLTKPYETSVLQSEVAHQLAGKCRYETKEVTCDV